MSTENKPAAPVRFEQAARAELLAMYTGMALQGILSNPNHSTMGKNAIAHDAVACALSAIEELEAYHTVESAKAADELRARAQAIAEGGLDADPVTESTGDVGSTAQ